MTGIYIILGKVFFWIIIITGAMFVANIIMNTFINLLVTNSRCWRILVKGYLKELKDAKLKQTLND